MPKRASRVELTALEHQVLEQVIRRHRSEQQVVLRARIVLAAGQGMTNAETSSRYGHPCGYGALVARSLLIPRDQIRSFCGFP